MTPRRYLLMTKSTVSRGCPSSSRLHDPVIRRSHIMAKRDWLERLGEAAEVKTTKDGKLDQPMFFRALHRIKAIGKMFSPWLRQSQHRPVAVTAN